MYVRGDTQERGVKRRRRRRREGEGRGGCTERVRSGPDAQSVCR